MRDVERDAQITVIGPNFLRSHDTGKAGLILHLQR